MSTNKLSQNIIITWINQSVKIKSNLLNSIMITLKMESVFPLTVIILSSWLSPSIFTWAWDSARIFFTVSPFLPIIDPASGPWEKSIKQSLYQSIIRSINHFYQSIIFINHFINQSIKSIILIKYIINQTFYQTNILAIPFYQSIISSINHLINQSIYQSIISINHFINHSTNMLYNICRLQFKRMFWNGTRY